MQRQGPSNERRFNVYYGWSNDGSGSSWTISSSVILAGSSDGSLKWDYPSIGVDGNWRVIIGAVKITGGATVGYFTAVSTDGMDFSGASCVAGSDPTCSLPGPGSAPGAQSRVIATDSVFHAFVPTLDSNNLPTLIQRYQSSDGVNWTGPLTIGMGSFAEPLNDTPGSPVLYYAPQLVASGYTSGRWSIAFQVKNGNLNNVVVCTSDWGCVFPNAATDDEFLVGTSVSGDNAYWVAYLA